MDAACAQNQVRQLGARKWINIHQSKLGCEYESKFQNYGMSSSSEVMFCLFTDTSEHFSDCYKNNVNLLSVNTTAIYLLSHFKLQSLFVLWIFSICGKYQCNFSRASNKTLQI